MRFATIVDPGAAEMDALLAIYREAIPSRERKPDSDVRAMAASPDHRVEVALGAHGEVVGFALVYTGKRLDLLEYLAVDARCRSSGTGAVLFARVLRNDRPLVVEVESDRFPSPDQATRTRRIGFYRRLGCQRISGLTFLLPLAGDGPPPPLDLLVAGCGAENVPRSQVGHWLRDIYTGVYAQPSDDPRIATMLATLPDRVGLE